MEPAAKAETQSIVSSDAGVNLKLNRILELLSKHSLCYEVTLHPQDLLVHSMVNGHDAISKGLHTQKTGLKPQLLPPCLEISPEKKKRQLSAKGMCSKAGGMLGGLLHLAPLTFSCFAGRSCNKLLAQMVRGRRPQQSLALCRRMAGSGHVVEDEFPTFAVWCQATLNSTNSASKMVGELEVMLQLASCLEQKVPMDSAIKMTQATAPSRSAYVDDISHFVSMFLGGLSFPLLQQVKDFSS